MEQGGISHFAHWLFLKVSIQHVTENACWWKIYSNSTPGGAQILQYNTSLKLIDFIEHNKRLLILHYLQLVCLYFYYKEAFSAHVLSSKFWKKK